MHGDQKSKEGQPALTALQEVEPGYNDSVDNRVMKQESSDTIELFYREQMKLRCSSSAYKHFFSATEDKRLNSNENFVEESSLKHETVYRSPAQHRNSFVFSKKLREIDAGRIQESYLSSTLDGFRTT